MNIAFVSSEVFPFAKTGGLGDVAGSLPIELAKLGCEIKLFMPAYASVKKEFDLLPNPDLGEIVIHILNHDYKVHVFESTLPDSKIPIYFVDCPYYFSRKEIYTNDPDEDERFILFSKSVLEIIQRLKWAPNIIHCNDWHTGLIPIYLKGNYSWDNLFSSTKTLFTIHNITYQGSFPIKTIAKADIKHEEFLKQGVCEYYGRMNFIKPALLTADKINTVSETYAHELFTPELGAGMEPFLQMRKNDFSGILNGVNYDIWNPAVDKLIPFQYSIDDLSNKIKNKKALLHKFDLPYRKNIPVIGIISRLIEQKGFDLISKGIYELMELNARWIILGDGLLKYKKIIKAVAKKYPKKISVHFGFNNKLAHLIEAGADIFLMPSRFEPCGLNQIYSLKYGTVPIVRKTGGLADTVEDWNESLSTGNKSGTGFSFVEYTPKELYKSLQRALKAFQNETTWKKIQMNGMQKDFSWNRSAAKYFELYKNLIV